MHHQGLKGVLMACIHQISTNALVLFLGVYLSSCVSLKPMNESFDHRFSHHALWTDWPAKEPQAVILMLHGLNLKPAKMDGWAQLLSSHGALVMRFALHGHTSDVSEMGQVSADRWREQFKEAVMIAHDEAQKMQVPLYFVGFSLGALVCLEYLATNKTKLADIAKMVLLAPAIATPWYSQTAVSLLSVLSKSMTLPSRSPKQYRANKGTSVAAYEALFKLKKSLHDAQFKNANRPTLVLIDQHDELVPSAMVKNLIASHKLGQWQLNIIDNRFAQENYGFRHLMVDEEAVGPALWASLSRQVLEYFKL